jgi:hypothetical protein
VRQRSQQLPFNGALFASEPAADWNGWSGRHGMFQQQQPGCRSGYSGCNVEGGKVGAGFMDSVFNGWAPGAGGSPANLDQHTIHYFRIGIIDKFHLRLGRLFSVVARSIDDPEKEKAVRRYE